MLFSIGDKFLLDDLEVEVVYVNHGDAWVAPVEGDLRKIAIDVIDKKGRTRNGSKAIVITNVDCGAV